MNRRNNRWIGSVCAVLILASIHGWLIGGCSQPTNQNPPREFFAETEREVIERLAMEAGKDPRYWATYLKTSPPSTKWSFHGYTTTMERGVGCAIFHTTQGDIISYNECPHTWTVNSEVYVTDDGRYVQIGAEGFRLKKPIRTNQ